jgi:hypothetical protein
MEYKNRLDHPIEFLESMLRNFTRPNFQPARIYTNNLVEIIKEDDAIGLAKWIEKVDFDPEFLGSAFNVVCQFAKEYLENLEEELPLADPGREEIAERIFSEYKMMSPEEWAARYSHTVGASSFEEYRYKNKVLHFWIHRLHKIMSNQIEIEKYRTHYLNESELAEIDDELSDLSGEL